MAMPGLLAAAVLISCAQPETSADYTNYNNTGGKTLVVYPVPAGTPQTAVCFSAKANGENLGMYSDTNAWGKPVNFTYFHIKDGTETTVEIEPDFDFSGYKILPENLTINGTRTGNKITFNVSKAGQNISLVFDENYMGPTLHVFVSAIDPNQPDNSSPNVIYFGPGYHDLFETHGGRLNVSGFNKTVYIAPGAVVNGTIFFDNAINCKITGGGVLMMADLSINPTLIALVFQASSHCTLGNIIANSRALPLDGTDKPYRGTWTTNLFRCTNMTVDGYRVVSPTWASTDSLNLIDTTNVTVKNCFLRACDDTISIKGYWPENAPAVWKPVENIAVSDCILWSDANNAMVLGEESRAEYYKNITFKNIDVLHSYDARTFGSDNFHLNPALNDRAVMSFVCLDGTYYSDVVFDNIRVNNCQRLICMTFRDDVWFGSLQGHQEYPGGMRDVIFSNITSVSPNSSSIANEVLLLGYAGSGGKPAKFIEKITFDNVKINGINLDTSYGRMTTNSYVRDLEFK